MKKVLAPPLLTLLLIVISIYAGAFFVGPRLCPYPHDICSNFLQLAKSGTLFSELFITCIRVLVGLGSAIILALALGMIAGFYDIFRAALYPLIFAFQSCPAIVWTSFLLIWVGVGSIVPMTAVALGTFPPIFLNTAEGIRGIEQEFSHLAKIYKFSSWIRFRSIIFPTLFSFFVSGISYALSIAWRVCVTAEFIAGGSGIGAQIHIAFSRLHMEELFAWSLLLILIGLFVERVLAKLIQKQASKSSSLKKVDY